MTHKIDATCSLPTIRRARGYRLYDSDGRRYLDFYQDDGRAILGHRPSGMILEIKNLLSRGQIAAYPSQYHHRTIKALKTLIPDSVDARIYASFDRALKAAAQHLGSQVDEGTIHDPAVQTGGTGGTVGVSLWRPFVESGDSPLLLPVLPVPIPFAPAVLVFREAPTSRVWESDVCSPVSLAALKRSIYDLIQHIAACDRSRWADFNDQDLWRRNGPYLTLVTGEADFPGLFNEMLSNGIVISPRFPGPSIIPAEYSPGEIGYVSGKRGRL